jgi:predicted amidohydrolase
MFRVGFCQFRPQFGRLEDNCQRIVRRLARLPADLVVLPELPFTGYFFANRQEVARLSQAPRTSPIVEALVELCRRRQFHLVTGFAEKDGERCFNSSLLIGPRGIVAKYRKVHLFNLEKQWFDAGDLGFSVKRVKGVRIGMMICFDWVFPEAARTLALDGAQVIAHPSNLVLDYCQRAMLTRCLENGVFAVTCNRFGEERRPHGRIRFTGRSQIVLPRGELLFRAAAQREVVHVETIDPSRAHDKMLTGANHLLRDRRPEMYHTTE